MSPLPELFERHQGMLPPTTAEERARLLRFVELLTEWNEKLNLVSASALNNLFGPHLADSLWVATTALEFAEDRLLVDVGTGGGLPGIPLAIRAGDRPVEFSEKLAKKRSFLSDVVARLPLTNVTVAGPYPPEGRRRRMMVTARAVFPPPQFFASLEPGLAWGSRMIFQRGGEAAPLTPPKGFRLLESRSYELPEGAGRRWADVFELVPRGTK